MHDLQVRSAVAAKSVQRTLPNVPLEQVPSPGLLPPESSKHEEERELQIHMLHRVFHSSLAEFKEFLGGTMQLQTIRFMKEIWKKT
jgi:predicted NACHT family NTPase